MAWGSAPGSAVLAWVKRLRILEIGRFESCADSSATNCSSLREVYELGGDLKGPFSTPLLWDKKEKKIVCNESTIILQIFNTTFKELFVFSEFIKVLVTFGIFQHKV